MDNNRQDVDEALDCLAHSEATRIDLLTEDSNKEQSTEKKGKYLVEPQTYKSHSSLNIPASLPHEVPSSDTRPYADNMALQQVMNLGPSSFSYHKSQGPASGYPSGPRCHFPPGLPQLPSTPGFLTGAGYHLPLAESSLLGSQKFPVCPLLPPGQAGAALHLAAIVGDKQKLDVILQEKNVNLEGRDQWGRVALVFAVLGNHQECVEVLLQAGARPDAADSHRRTPLHFAAYKGHLGCIKSILHAVESKSLSHLEYSNGVWLAQDMRGVTPLHHAAIHSNHKCLQALLKYTVAGTLDTEDHKKRTPLHWAAAYGSQENVRLLIKHGANNLMPDQEGKTPLHWAAISKANGAKDCVRTLIGAAPSNVNWQDFDGITALHIAVAEARKDTVDVILSVPNCNVNLTDNHFRTALHWACNRGVRVIADHLMRRVAQVDAVDIYGATPLHYAAKHNHADVVELLVRRPRMRDVPTVDGHTSLMWAAAQGADSALTVMVRHGVSLTQADPRGCTALHIAGGAGHVSTVRVLLHLQAPLDACANDGRTPVHCAARAGHTQIVKVLAKAGASLQHRDKEGQCALHHAVLGGHLYLAQILIRAGTSVNVHDYYGRTPLHMAAYRGLSDIMFLLLENRGDVNARDFEGLSALHWAAEQGHLGAVNTLLDFHAYPNYTQSTSNRYTPYDCACIAEHLEVAQVLTEAGGISVTRIMEVAAIKIQAAVRGYLTRKKLRRQKRPLLDQEGELNTDIEDRVSGHSLWILNLDFTPSKSSVDQTSLEAGKQTKDLNTTVNASDVSGKKEEKGPTSKLNSMLHSGASEHGPFNSVSGQRRSKALPTSIMRGTRKKTVRNLELPGLHELGINQLKPQASSPEDYEYSDPVADITEELRPVVTEVLQQSDNVATVVTGRAHSQHTQDFSLSMKSSQAVEIEKRTLPTAVDEKTSGICMRAHDNEDENDNFINSNWYRRHLHFPHENETKINKHQRFESKESKSMNEIFSFKDNIEFDIKKAECIHKGKHASFESTDVDESSRNTAKIFSERKVLSEEALRQRERKWKNRVASASLQRKPVSISSKSEEFNAYKLMKAHSPQQPAGKIETKSISTKDKDFIA